MEAWILGFWGKLGKGRGQRMRKTWETGLDLGFRREERESILGMEGNEILGE